MGYIAVATLSRWVAAHAAKKQQAMRRAARAAAGLHRRNSCPVEFVDGVSAPRQEGDSGHYLTPGGTRVRHPSAYRKVALSSRLLYVASSNRVVVGRAWLGFAPWA